MNLNKNLNSNISELNSNEENIDFLKIIDLFLRNKKLFSIITLITGGLSLFYSTTFTPRWKGEFDIVLANRNAESNLGNLSSLSGANLSRLIKGKTDKENIETQVEILKSASVLMPIFNEIKEIKGQKGIDTSEWRFSSWQQDNLVMNIKDGTKVFNITYLDEDKDLIIPTLIKISNTYKSYLREEKAKDIDLALEFVNEGIREYKSKAKKSLKNEKEFITKYNIDPISYGLNQTSSDTNIEKPSLFFGGSIEKLKSRINLLKININEIKNNDPEYAYYFLKNIEEDNIVNINDLTTVIEIEKLNKRIINFKGVYKDDDREFVKLRNRKKELMKENKYEIINLLESNKKIAENNYKNLKRPNNLLVEYKLIVDERQRNNVALKQLELEKITLSLESTRTENAWKLITNPTLFPIPIKPSKKLFLLYGLLIGSIISLIIAKLKEIKNDTIFYSEELISIFNNYDQIVEIRLDQEKYLESFLKSFFKKFPLNSDNVISFIYDENNFNDKSDSLIRRIKDYNSKIKFSINKDINKIEDFHNLIVIGELGNSKKKYLKNIKDIIDLNNWNINYLLFLK